MRRSLLALALLVLAASALEAQTTTAAGVTYTYLSLDYPDDESPSGFGGWYSYDLAPSNGLTVGLDLGGNYFPENDPLIGRQLQLFGGMRGGLRTERFGAFGRLRPGLMYFSERFLAPDVSCVAIFPTPEPCLTDTTNFAVDLGGTFEFYALERLVVRADLGNTIVRFRRSDLDPIWQKNLQFSAGAGYRF